MTQLNFIQVGGEWISDEFSAEEAVALHINFNQGPLFTTLKLQRTVDSAKGWATAYVVNLTAEVFEDTIVGCSSSILLRVVLSKEPVEAYYVEL